MAGTAARFNFEAGIGSGGEADLGAIVSMSRHSLGRGHHDVDLLSRHDQRGSQYRVRELDFLLDEKVRRRAWLNDQLMAIARVDRI